MIEVYITRDHTAKVYNCVIDVDSSPRFFHISFYRLRVSSVDHPLPMNDGLSKCVCYIRVLKEMMMVQI